MPLISGILFWRNQFALVADMERKMDQMEALIAAL